MTRLLTCALLAALLPACEFAGGGQEAPDEVATCSPACAAPTPTCKAGVCAGCATLGCAANQHCNTTTGLCEEHVGTKVGAACSQSSECEAGGTGTPVCLTQGYPDGYCAVQDCAGHGHDCPDDPGLKTEGVGTKCTEDSGTLRCLRLCADNAGCRSGYACVERQDAAGHGVIKVCLPR